MVHMYEINDPTEAFYIIMIFFGFTIKEIKQNYGIGGYDKVN